MDQLKITDRTTPAAIAAEPAPLDVDVLDESEADDANWGAGPATTMEGPQS